MTPKERAAELLLNELKTGQEQWYYISIAAEVFHGGIVLQGKGPTDAWMRCHGLNLIPKDHETLTNGPIEDDIMARIPEAMRYRLLSREEATSLGS